MVLGANTVGIIMVIFLWGHAPSQALLLWLFLILSCAAMRLYCFRCYQRDHDSVTQLQYWGRLFYTGSFFAGCVWGVLPVLLYTQIAPQYLLLISAVFAAMVSATAATGSVYLPSFYAFAVPLVLPICWMHLVFGVDYLAVTGVMLLLYLVVNSLFAHRSHRQYVELVESRFTNLDLMQQLNEEKLTAERAVEVKSLFMAAASHDLRQPLHALGMFIGSLRQRETDKERLTIIRDMEASTESLSQLLHSMLDLSKLQADMVTTDVRTVALGRLLKNLKAEFEPQAIAKSLELSIPDTTIAVQVDSLLLARILRNLLSNAIKYTERGHVSMTVSQEKADCCKLMVADTGCGIDTSEHESVFKDYVQLPHPKRRASRGLGLGLAIVRRYCQLLDIPIELNSQLGQGAEFVLSLKTSTQCRTLPGVVKESYVAVTHTSVLIIDDEKSVVSAMQKLLNDWGCQAIAADSAKSALYQLALQERLPDLILCDYRMRANETGLDVVQSIHEGTLQRIPVVFVTGDTSPEILREVVDQGHELLYKPVSEIDLKRVLSQRIIN